MKLQGHISKKIKGKEYVKFVVVIPTDIIKKLGWRTGKDVDFEVQGDKLILS